MDLDDTSARGEEPHRSIQNLKFGCDVIGCGSMFSSHDSLNRHKKQVHETKKLFVRSLIVRLRLQEGNRYGITCNNVIFSPSRIVMRYGSPQITHKHICMGGLENLPQPLHLKVARHLTFSIR